jgi:hypothetical protein
MGAGALGGMTTKTGIATLCCTSTLARDEIADAILAAATTLTGDTRVTEVHVSPTWGEAAPNAGRVEVCVGYDGYAWDVYDVLRRLKPEGVTIREVHTPKLDHGDDC